MHTLLLHARATYTWVLFLPHVLFVVHRACDDAQTEQPQHQRT